jgi:hypothetical protein
MQRQAGVGTRDGLDIDLGLLAPVGEIAGRSGHNCLDAVGEALEQGEQ